MPRRRRRGHGHLRRPRNSLEDEVLKALGPGFEAFGGETRAQEDESVAVVESPLVDLASSSHCPLVGKDQLSYSFYRFLSRLCVDHSF